MEKLKSSNKSFEESIYTLNTKPPSQNPFTSQRFFFSPCKTKDIMELEEFKSESRTNIRKPSLKSTKLSFSDETLTMVMDSFNPFRDFRESMKEMVEANEIREWKKFEELLHCYLRLNEKKNHKIIMLAFVDLLMHMMSRDKEGFYASFPLNFYLDIL